MMSADREMVPLPGGYKFARRVDGYYAVCTPEGLSGFTETEAHAFVAALHPPADEIAFTALLIEYGQASAAQTSAPVKESATARQRCIAAGEAVVKAYRAASRAPVGLVDGRCYRHKKRGTTYRVIGEAQVQCGAKTGQGLTDYEIVVVYKSIDGEDKGNLWVRRHSEFHDGRFEALASSTQPVEARQPSGDAGELGGALSKVPSDRDIIEAIRQHTSPTVGAGDIHGDVPGMILYEDHQRFVIAGLRRVFAAPKASTPAGDASGGAIGLFMAKLKAYRHALIDNRMALVGAKVVEAREADVIEFVRALSTQSVPLGRENAGASDISRYFPLPLIFRGPPDDNEGPQIRDAKGNPVAFLMWPLHSVDETERAVQATYALGRAMALAAAPEPPADKAGAAVGGQLPKPDRAWAYRFATKRQGQSDTPRCEAPSEYDIESALKLITWAVETALPTTATVKSRDGGERP